MLKKLGLLVVLSIFSNAEIITAKHEITLKKDEIRNCPTKSIFSKIDLTICKLKDDSMEIVFESSKHNIAFKRLIDCNNGNEGYKIITQLMYTKKNNSEEIENGYIKNIYSCLIEKDKIFIEIIDKNYIEK